MNEKGFKTGSLTLAAKGRDILLRNGYKAYLARDPHPKNGEGCGYLIYVADPDRRALDILARNGIKIYGFIEKSDRYDLS